MRRFFGPDVKVVSEPFYPSILIEQYGDSTTLGLTLMDGEVTGALLSAADHLYLHFQRDFGSSVLVANKGVSRTCALDLLSGREGELPWRERVAESLADIVTFNYGMNDAWSYGRSPDEFSTDLHKLIVAAKTAGKIPVLIEPNPSSQPERVVLTQYVDAMNFLAIRDEVPIIQHFHIWKKLATWSELLSDGTHPNAAGYEKKGRDEFEVLAKIVRLELAKQALRGS